MIYSSSANLAFYHFPKTGGSSLRKFFQRTFPDACNLGDEHEHLPLATYFDLLSKMGVEPRHVRIFTTIRHPFGLVDSVYRFWRRVALDNPQDKQEHFEAARVMTFAEFVAYFTQTGAVFDEQLRVNGSIPNNLSILRIEYITEELHRYLNARLGMAVSIDVPLENVTGPTDATADAWNYDAQSKELVMARFAWAFAEGYYTPDDALVRRKREHIRQATRVHESKSWALAAALISNCKMPIRTLLSRLKLPRF